VKKSKRTTRRMRDMSEGFPLLFDPRTPVLFILGGALLSMFGNACYDLMLLWLGEGWLSIVITGLGSLLLLVVVVLAIYLVARTHKQPSTLIDADERAAQRPGLVLFLSPGPSKAHEEAFQWHQPLLKYVWLLYTSEVEKDKNKKLEHLLEECRQKEIQVSSLRIANPRNAEEARKQVLKALEQAEQQGLKQGDLYVDITSCMRPGAVGATLACWQTGYDLEYVTGDYDAEGRLIPGTSEAMRVKLGPGVPQKEETV